MVDTYSRNQSTVTEFILLGLSENPFVQILLFPTFLIIYMATLTMNVLLIVAVRNDNRLHTTMYIFFISFTGCAIQFFFFLFLGETECLLLALMAYDRYVAICSPLHYNLIMNTRVCLWMIAMSWITGCIITSIDTYVTFNLTYCGPNIINHFFCELPQMLQLSCSDISSVNIIKLVGIVILLPIPLSLILFSYIRIVVAVMTIRLGKNKAFSTCISHLVVVAIFYGTALFMYAGPEHLGTEDTDKKVALFYTVINPMLNPLIYSLRNKDVHRAMKKLMRT
uniref:Olfactory receptor n=1 Tax=Pyxicephalus adspersus TaxID=30357 RepID=A0AAV3AG63_PYXAD|nr:TPA: hypothetical protein GDO54_009948 [Pyxicephalus adspersus]